MGDDNGNTPLFLCSILVDCKYVDMLLKAGADVNTMDVGGRTPLMVASGYGRRQVRRSVIESRS